MAEDSGSTEKPTNPWKAFGPESKKLTDKPLATPRSTQEIMDASKSMKINTLNLNQEQDIADAHKRIVDGTFSGNPTSVEVGIEDLKTAEGPMPLGGKPEKFLESARKQQEALGKIPPKGKP